MSLAGKNLGPSLFSVLAAAYPTTDHLYRSWVQVADPLGGGPLARGLPATTELKLDNLGRVLLQQILRHGRREEDPYRATTLADQEPVAALEGGHNGGDFNAKLPNADYPARLPAAGLRPSDHVYKAPPRCTQPN